MPSSDVSCCARPWRMGRWIELGKGHRFAGGRGHQGGGGAAAADIVRRRRRGARTDARAREGPSFSPAMPMPGR